MRHLKRQHLLAAVAGGLVAGRDGAGTAAAFCFPSSAVSSVGGGGRGAGSIGGILRSISADLPDISAEALQEAEAIMSKLQSSADGPGVGQGLPGQEKYMPSIKEGDPVVEALCKVLGCESVEGFTLLDSRWNGNEAFRFDTDRGPFFAKLNRVEDPSVFMTEAVSLTILAKAVKCPKPLHIGKLPKVGDIGPGAFMILEWMDLQPFGAMRSDVQKALGDQLADMHLSSEYDSVHKGRFGFPVSNFLALTPLDNTWRDTWVEFFGHRLASQIAALYADKAYGRAPLKEGTDGGLGEALEVVIAGLPELLATIDPIKSSLLHGDLWIGNVGGLKAGACMYDPASFFGHSEFDLAIMPLFGGYGPLFFEAYHSKIPKAPGFERRQRVYQLYQLLNQLNLFGDPEVGTSVQKLTQQILQDLK